MILTIRIDLDQSKENYQAVIKALESFDIASASWEDQAKPTPPVDPKLRGSTDDLGSSLSQAIASYTRHPKHE